MSSYPNDSATTPTSFIGTSGHDSESVSAPVMPFASFSAGCPEIAAVLRRAAEIHASDVLMVTGHAVSFRIAGTLCKQPEMLSAEQIASFRHAQLGPERENFYSRTSSADAANNFTADLRLRMNFYETIAGPAVTVRLVCNGDGLDIDRLKLPQVLKKLASSRRGLLLFSGSTGNGKTTSLGAFINYINQNYKRHILTLEDPVEYCFTSHESMISQRELSSSHGDRFDLALRSAMRENPDIIVIGEIRDKETFETALSAALTGHFVISTVHTSDAVQAIERMIMLFPDDQQQHIADDLGLALTGIFAERLIPSATGQSYVPAFEILLGTGLVCKMISTRDYAGLENALNRNVEQGMLPFKRSIYKLFRDGEITAEAARDAATNRDEFEMIMQGLEIGVDTFRNFYGTKFDDNDDEMVDMKRLFHSAVRHNASDLILSVGAPPALRIDGNLRQLDMPALRGDDVQRLLYAILNQRQRTKLEEERELDFAISIDDQNEKGKQMRFRVNAFYQRGSLGVVARTLFSDIPDYRKLGIPATLIRMLNQKNGLILICGATGSGKSTTLACCIDYINRSRCAHIITIEDPVEFVFENNYSIIEQRELHDDTMSFATALKYAMRETPDVIMVGEMRDYETMAAALSAAETGHLVLATIHTNSAAESINRIIDSFPQAQQNQIRTQLASVIVAVVSQCLLPRKDNSGRIAAFEVMLGTVAAKSLIREGKAFQLPTIMETSQRDGMMTMDRALNDLFEQGIISKETMDRYRIKDHRIEPQ